MAKSNGERWKATQVRKRRAAGTATADQLAWLESYEASKGQAPPPPPSSSASSPPPPAEPPPSSSGAPPPVDVDLSGVPGGDQAAGGPGEAGGPGDAAAAAAAAARAQMVEMAATQIVGVLKACSAVMRQAMERGDSMLPPLPDFALDMVVKPAWMVCLDKWLPNDAGGLDEVAPYVAISTSAYQVGGATYAHKRMKDREPLGAPPPPPPPPPPPASSRKAPPPPAPPPPPAASSSAPTSSPTSSGPERPQLDARLALGPTRSKAQEEGDWIEWQRNMARGFAGSAEEPSS